MISTTFKYKSFNFPCGERHIVVEDLDDLPQANITFEYQNDSEIIELLLIVDAIKRIGGYIHNLEIPYVPYSRQDRVNIQGECFSLKVFCFLINSIKAKEVFITDPHSDVTTALLNNVTVIPQYEIFEKYFRNIGVFSLVCPDGGALKKIHKLASITHPSRVIECSKIRDTSTGEISGIRINDNHLAGRDFYIVDDICDGGRTFIEIAKVLKQHEARKIVLMVTHGFFTKGLEVFDNLIDEVYTRKGRVK